VASAFLFITSVFAEEAKKEETAKADSGTEIVEMGWQKRCADKKSEEAKKCEIFQRLAIKKSDMRVAEFAIGFPEKKDTARGVVVLPLGILLEPGVAMKIDDGKPFVFKARYCVNAGCFSYINLDKSILDSMKKGKLASFFFKTAEGQDVNLIMNLTGFEKAMKGISG
jgi:invasion protein IalB